MIAVARRVGPARTDTAGWAAELVAVAIAEITSTLLGPSVFGQLRELSAVSYDLVDGAAGDRGSRCRVTHVGQAASVGKSNFLPFY